MHASGSILRSPVKKYIPLVESLKHLHEAGPFSIVIQQIPACSGHELPQIRVDGAIQIIPVRRVESYEA